MATTKSYNKILYPGGGPLMNAPLDFLKQPHQGEPLTEFNEGGSHEENENGGIPQGMNPNGQQNLVEQGETKLNSKDYIFSDRLIIDKQTAKDFYFPNKYVGKTFAEVSKLMSNKESKREFDTIEEEDKKRNLDGLMVAQEHFKSMFTGQPNDQSMNPEVSDPSLGLGRLETPMAAYGGYQNRMDFGGFSQPVGIQDQMQFAQAQSDMMLKSDNQQAIAEGEKSGSQIGAAIGGLAGSFIPIPGVGTAIGTMAGSFLGKKIGGAVANKAEGGYLYGNDNAGQGNSFGPGGPLNQPWQPWDPNTSFASKKMVTDPNQMFAFRGDTVDIDPSPELIPSDEPAPATKHFLDEGFDPDKDGDGIIDNDNDNDGIGKRGTAQPDIHAQDKNLEDITQPNMKQTGLNAAGTYAPVAYNLITGTFGKVNHLKPEDYMNTTKLANWRNNTNPQLKNAEEAFASGAIGIRNSGAGGGAYLANMQELAANKGRTNAEINANAENEYNNRQLQIDQMNAARGDMNAAQRLKIAEFNLQADAAKRNMLRTGINQIGDIASSDTQNKLGLEYAKMGNPNVSKGFDYTTYLESILNKNKKN